MKQTIYINPVYDYIALTNELKVNLYLKGYNYNLEEKEYKLLNKKSLKLACNKITADKDTIFITKKPITLTAATTITLNGVDTNYYDLIEELKNIEFSTLYHYYIVEKIAFQSLKDRKIIVKKIDIKKHEKTKIFDILKDKQYNILSENYNNIDCVYSFKINDTLYVNDIEDINDNDISNIRKIIYTEYSIFKDGDFNNIHRDLITTKCISKKYGVDIPCSYDTETTNCTINKDIFIDKNFLNSIKDNKNLYEKFTDETIPNAAITYNYNFNIINKLYGVTFNARSQQDLEKLFVLFEKIFSFNDIITTFFVHNLTHDFLNTETKNYRFDNTFMNNKSNFLTAFLSNKEKTEWNNIDILYSKYMDNLMKYNDTHTRNLIPLDKTTFRNSLVTSNIKFRDSYIYFNKKLDLCCKDLPSKNHDEKTLTIFKDVKMSGDLDYTLPRNWKTPLTMTEINYIFNDTFALSACIMNELFQYGSLKNIPLTSTGKVRTYIKESCKKHSNKKEQEKLSLCVPDKEEQEVLINTFAGGYTNGNFNIVGKLMLTTCIKDNLETILNNKLPIKSHNEIMVNKINNYNFDNNTYESVESYLQAKQLKNNIYTINYKMKSYKGIYSMDLTSAYPYMCVSKKFPYQLIAKHYNKDIKFVEQLVKEHNQEKNTSIIYAKCDLVAKNHGKNHNIPACLLYASKDKNEKILLDIMHTVTNEQELVELYNVESKTSRKNRHVKRDKTNRQKKIDANVFNGRYKNVKNYHFYGTIIDFIILNQIYNISNFVCFEAHIYSVDYLPKWYILAIAEFYNGKTSLKGTDDIINYMNSKGNLNSTYGMMVQKPVQENYRENEDYSDIEKCDVSSDTENTFTNEMIFKLYQWGVFITAYTRQLIIETALKLGVRYLYSDTDSIKFASDDIEYDYNNIIAPINNKIINDTKKICKHYGLDYYKTFCIANKDGIKYDIGVFDIENSFVYQSEEYSYAEIVQYKKVNNLNINIWEYIKPYLAFKYICPKKYIYLDYDHKIGEYKIKHTIGGVSKKAIDNKIKEERKKGKSDIEIMDKVLAEGLEIEEDKTGKNRGIISRQHFMYTHIDYLGNKVNGYHFKSKALTPAKFRIREHQEIVYRDYENPNDIQIGCTV